MTILYRFSVRVSTFLFRLRRVPLRSSHATHHSPVSTVLPPLPSGKTVPLTRLRDEVSHLEGEVADLADELRETREKIAELKQQTIRKTYSLSEYVPHFLQAMKTFQNGGDRLDREYVHHAVSLCFYLQNLLETAGVIPLRRQPPLNDMREKVGLIHLLFEVYAEKIERVRSRLPEDDPILPEVIRFWEQLRDLSIQYESMK